MLKLFLAALAAAAFGAQETVTPPPLPHDQPFYLAFRMKAGPPVRVELPPGMLNELTPSFSDIRLIAPDGREAPYSLWTPLPAGNEPACARVLDFSVRLSKGKTVALVETDPNREVASVALDLFDAASYIKSVSVYASSDKDNWRKLVSGAPVFGTTGRPGNSRVDFAPVKSRYLKIELDDSSSAPVGLRGLALGPALPRAPVGERSLEVRVSSVSRPSMVETLYLFDLPARHMAITGVEPVFEAPQGLFWRRITLSDREEGRLVPLGEDILYTVGDGRTPARRRVFVNARNLSGALALRSVDYDNEPLSIKAVRVYYAPTYAVFEPRKTGVYAFAFGNQFAARARYNVVPLMRAASSAPVVKMSAEPEKNAGYERKQVAPMVSSVGAALDTTQWKYRAPVQVASEGIYGLELPMNVLSGARCDLSDLRLVRDGKQIPYVTDREHIERTSAPELVSRESKNGITTWTLRLPARNLPITQISFQTPALVFSRTFRVYEKRTEAQGNPYDRVLGEIAIVRDAQERTGRYIIPLRRVSEDVVRFEVVDGDNAPLDIGSFLVYYKTERLVFKGEPGALWLYYGNPNAGFPSYDILAAFSEMVGARRQEAVLGPQERLAPGEEGSIGMELSKHEKFLVWAGLALVAAGLLFAVRKLLPPEA